MDEYVYLCSNDGGWNNWSRMMLARVPRNKFPRLDRRDWKFFLTLQNPLGIGVVASSLDE
jgi:hypothetical protein